MKSVTDQVARQYEAFPYPAFDPQWDKYIAFGDPSIFSPLLWPEGPPRKNLRILVAGCGTVEAARYAFRNPNCQVLGIDISEAAIKTHSRLKDERNLDNLEVRRLDLHEVANSERVFDLIMSNGVLHHLERPEEGLRALAAVLDKRGAIVLMLYGGAPRLGVYLLQDVFRRMGLAADQTSVELVRAVLDSLPKHHYFHWYSSHAPDLASDAGLVDTLLHVRDRAYSVPQTLQLMEDCGLRFQSWEDNYFYFPEGNIRPDTPLWKKVKAIPDREQWAVVENLMLSIGRHAFIAHRPERSSCEINFSNSSWPDYIPMRVPGLSIVEEEKSDPQRPLRGRRGKIEFLIDRNEAALFASCNGKRTISHVVYRSTLQVPPTITREAYSRSFFERMWKLGHLWMLRAPH
jgi:SAM-dependent methyltransferase